MRYKIIHKTNYTFSEPVFLEPHFLRFHPKTLAHQKLINHQLTIDPSPVGSSSLASPEDNLVQLVWFEGQHTYLNLRVESEVTVDDFNPFDFLVLPAENIRLGVSYPETVTPALQVFLSEETWGEDIKKYVEEVAAQVQYESMPFLVELNTRLHKDFKKILRQEGPPHSPKSTFGSRSGSCRDLTVLFIHISRNLGLASRFVSGYLYHEELEDSHELHAWAEVYLPGAGWRGFDPTMGLVVSGSHISVTSSHDPQLTLPVTGTIRGIAKSSLEATVEVIKVL